MPGNQAYGTDVNNIIVPSSTAWAEINLYRADWMEFLLSNTSPQGVPLPGGFETRRHFDPRTGYAATLLDPPAAPLPQPGMSSIQMRQDFWNAVGPAGVPLPKRGANITKVVTLNGPGIFSIPFGAPQIPFVPLLCYCHCITVPDFTPTDMATASWTGSLGAPMGPGRFALQIEHVFSPLLDPVTQVMVPGSDAPFQFQLAATFRGYGCPNPAPISPAQTQDTAVAGVIPNPGGTIAGLAEPTAFPGMLLNSGFPGASPSVDFALGDSGLIARVQHLIQLPETASPGDIVELEGAFNLANAGFSGFVAHPGIQWTAAKYRWIAQPYPFTVNSGKQLLAATGQGQPRDVNGNV
jgi:hypothetical protein